MSYKVKLKQFEGPLDLLLDLIEKNKLEITEISLAQIADQYLEHLKKIESINPASLADFLVIAAKLILIKSRALLPILELTPEEEEDIEELKKQLELYKKFRRAGRNLRRLIEQRNFSYSREAYLGLSVAFYPPSDLVSGDLARALRKVITELPTIEKLPEEVITRVVSLQEKIREVKGRVEKEMETSFQNVINGAKDKIDIIVAFLALLELIKRRVIYADQTGIFKEIKLVKNESH